LERYAYDPWGGRRSPTDWTQKDTRTSWRLNRGYTMHEHLDAFGIINMNGRVYDPQTAQFFSPDPYLQAPNDWLNYNRYSYCLNNPLKYTDPSGEVFGIDDIIIMAAFAYIGGMQANFFYAAGHNTNPFNPGNWNWQSPGTYAGIASGLSSGVTVGIGNTFGHRVGSWGNELLRAGAHGIFGGVTNWANGGNFWEGFAVGGVSSLAGSGMQAMGWGGDYLPLVTGLAGAGTSWALGGDPMSGFGQGFSIGALNHKGEKITGDDGKTYELMTDDAMVWGRAPASVLQTIGKYNDYVKMINDGVSVLADVTKYFSSQELAWLKATGRLTRITGGVTVGIDAYLTYNAYNNGQQWGWHAYDTGVGIVGQMGIPGAVTATSIDTYVSAGRRFYQMVNWFNAHGFEWMINSQMNGTLVPVNCW